MVGSLESGSAPGRRGISLESPLLLALLAEANASVLVGGKAEEDMMCNARIVL